MQPLEVQWRNFRGMSRAQRLTFPRLTVLIGRNNVGKTSAYAPLLVMRQTLDAKDPATALLSRGPLMDIGTYRDFAFGHETGRDVHLRVSIPGDTNGYPWLESTQRARSLAVAFSAKETGEIWLKSHVLTNAQNQLLVSRQRQSHGTDFEFSSPFLPKNTSVGRPLKEVSELKEALQREQPEGFMFSGAQGLRLPAIWREDPDRWNKVRPWFNAVNGLYDIQMDALHRLEDVLRGIAYLGPLRSLPQRTYRLAAETPSDVGREGEFAPEILFRQRDTELRERVEGWLKTLGYGRLEFNEAGDDYFQLHLKGDSGQRVNIAHSGVGVSQLLPILVQGFTSSPSATFISQQPEIHLNPAQQSVIADFLIEASAEGRRVIVETHSEHVLLRVRRRVAEGLLAADEVAIYYFDSKDGSTVVRQVPLGDAGEVETQDWPSGFFEEQLNDAFALATAQAKRA